jgi:hypothetical protein
MSTQRYSVDITSIVCEATADTGGNNDEVFVIWQADGGVPVRYPATGPQNMNSTASSNAVSTWNIPSKDLHLVFEKEAVVTLWDSQHSLDPSSAIYLMSYEYTAPGINPGYPASATSYTMSNHNGGKYTINATAVTEATIAVTGTLQAEVKPHFATIKGILDQAAPRAARSGAPTAVSEEEARTLRVLAELIQAWKSSPEGAARLEAMRGLDLKGIHAELDSIVKGPHFAGALQLAASQGRIDLSGFQSFTLGFALTGEIVLGAYGAIGYACDMSVVKGQGGATGIYVIGAIAEEIGAGIDGLVEAGVWKQPMSSLGGSYTALALDLGDFGEVGYFQFKSDDEIQGYVVGVGIGADDEVGDLDPAYMFLFPVTSSYPVMQEEASNCLILTKLQCLNKLAKSGHDEVTLYITADAPSGSSTTYRYPTWDDFAMGDDSDDFNIWYPGRSVMFNNSVTVKASDGGTELASFTFNLSDFSSVGSTQSPTSNMSQGFQNISYQLTALLITKGS